MKHEKIAPGLMAVLDDYHEQGQAGLTRHMRTLGLVAAQDSPKPPRTVVFIHCAAEADLERLHQYGVRVNQAKGAVRTAFLPLDSLDPLSDDPAVERIIPSRYLRTVMDVAPGKVKLPEFRTGSGLSGQSVVVGTVDTGIDPNHPAFAGRILRIWDQTLPGPGVAEGGYGVELTGAVLTVSRDTEGHGTHVAGIAAGAPSTYGGVAPGADLVIVKSDLQDAHIADGIRYIFRVAHDLGRPAVVNLSLGGHGDPHDGTDSLSLIIDAESGPGRIVCCAAGNEGRDNIHAQVQVPQGKTRTITLQVPAAKRAEGPLVAVLNGWYSGGDQVEVSIKSPTGEQTPFQGVITSGSPGKSYKLKSGWVRIFTPGPDPANGDHNFLVEIRHPGSTARSVAPGVWQLVLRSAAVLDGRVDVWTLDNGQSIQALFTGKGVQNLMKIGSPGAAGSAVTVGSYTTKVQWTDIDGNPEKVKLKLDDISDFSSPGPLRKGGQKPDVAAPGAMIAAPLSADSQVTRTNVVADGFRVMAGTSMATPFVTGIVALLLEHNRDLDPDKIKTLLRESSSIPSQPAGAFDPTWGFGLIDGMRLLAAYPSRTHIPLKVKEIEDRGDFIIINGVRVDKRTKRTLPDEG